MKVGKCRPKIVQFLPLNIDFNFQVDSMPDDPMVVWRLKSNPGVCDVKLKIIKTQFASLTALVPESVLSTGPGLYEVAVFDGCNLCATQPIRLKRNCKLRSCVITEPQPVKPDDNCGKFQTPLN